MEQETLGGLLRRCRLRIKPDTAWLGQTERLKAHVGKPVTQEEVAEVAGISREWYATIEKGRATRVSAITLARIATALMLDPAERTRAFQLALPEWSAGSISRRSSEVLDAFAPIRSAARRLFVATTEAEIFSVAEEVAFEQLRTHAVISGTRLGEGDWSFHAFEKSALGHDDYVPFAIALIEKNGKAAIDDLNCYPILAAPGEVITRAELDARYPLRAQRLNPTMNAFGLDRLSSATACVRSRRGIVGQIAALSLDERTFSTEECAAIGAIADLASLALS